MKFILSIVILTSCLLMVPHVSMSNANANSSVESWLWDRGISWLQRKIRSYAQVEITDLYEEFVGTKPSYEDLMRMFADDYKYACDFSNADFSGVWINNAKIGSFQNKIGQYTVSANTPYELESKNFTSAGLKQYAKYYHSFIVYESYGKATVKDNLKKHRYTAPFVFTQVGNAELNSATYSNYELSINLNYTGGDFNYPIDVPSLSSFKADFDYTGDYYLSDCGSSTVKVEYNEAPKIGGITSSSPQQVYPGERTRAAQIYSTVFSAYDVNDKHSKNENLTYRWLINGVYAGQSKTAYYEFYQNNRLPLVNVELIVSDGDKSKSIVKSFDF